MSIRKKYEDALAASASNDQEQMKALFKEISERMRSFTIKNAVIIEIDDPNAPAFQTVGRTRKGVRIIKANRDAARRAAKKAAVKYKALSNSAA